MVDILVRAVTTNPWDGKGPHPISDTNNDPEQRACTHNKLTSQHTPLLETMIVKATI